WNTGYLSCGDRYTAPPGLVIKTPGVTANGYANFYGFFVNDTSGDNWVTYQPYLYQYGHGWGWDEWSNWIYVPPGTGVNAITHGLGFANPGYDAYLIGAVYVWWWNGYKD